MRLIFLGTGTSQGIPVIGCACDVCNSSDPRDKRLRSSVLFEQDGFNLLIDTSPDLRQQMLINNLDRIDAICITHEHNDHVIGLDDVRPINFKWKKAIPIYTMKRVQNQLMRRFHYAFETNYAARPRLTLHDANPGDRIQLGPFDVRVLAVDHGYLDILGFAVNDAAYLTDVKSLSDDVVDSLHGIEVLVISALQKQYHDSHQTLEEAVALIERIQPTQAYITHLSHRMGKHNVESEILPSHIDFAYDGLTISISS